MQPDTGVVVVAAGRGVRLGGVPKQFRDLGGVPLLLRALEPFLSHPEVAMIVTVGRSGVTAARVGADSWSSSSGKAVNECLNERAANAWKVASGEVPAGTYQVDLRFTGGT